jgi:hypothetical protein
MNYRIVVARCDEDISWTKQFKNVIIYIKGKPIEGDYKLIRLPNVGREGHTYYKHICDNYDNLDDYTVFLQGNPFDHSPDLVKDLSKYIDAIDNAELDVDFEFLSNQVTGCNLSGCRFHRRIPLIEVYEKLFNVRKQNWRLSSGWEHSS